MTTKRDDVYLVCCQGVAANGLLLAAAAATPLHRMMALTAMWALAVGAWITAPTLGARSTAWFLALLSVGMMWILATAPPAAAQNAPTYRSHYDDSWGHGRRLVVRQRQTRKVWRHHHVDDGCKAPLAVVGDQYATVDGAKQEADKSWMQTARWQHGERFMDRDNADEASYECGRSSVGSVAGQTFTRCRLIARPCRPDRSKEDR